MTDELKTVARCERCGRGFISMPNDNRDRFYPHNKPLRIRDMPTDEICGGMVRYIEERRDNG